MTPVKDSSDRSFRSLVEKAVVHEQDLDGWEFGKRALSGNSYSAAVLQSYAQGKAKEV